MWMVGSSGGHTTFTSQHLKVVPQQGHDQSEGFQGDTKRESWMVFMENPINDMGSYLKSELVILDDLFFIYFIFSGCFNEIDTEKSIGTSFEITRKIRT